MRVILDFPGGRQAFQAPRAIITADHAAQVPAALAALSQALAEGRCVAGWLGYELGYALEARLGPLRPAGVPLLRLGVFDAPAADVTAPLGRAYAGPLHHDWDEAAYLTRFAAVKQMIAAGDIYQANLSYRARFHFAGDPLALYERLRATARAPWCGFVDDDERQILSLSPELFFELSATGVIAARPMKGTAPRDGDDLAEGKPTLPLICAMRQGTPAQAAFIRRAIEDGGRDHIAEVIQAIESTGAIAYTAGAARRESDLAMAALEALPASPHKDAMYALAAFAVQRDH